MIDEAKIAHRQYVLAVQTILTDFQFIEESLKMYIGLSFQSIRKRIHKDIPFGFSIKNVQNVPLGKLISKFKKLNSNNELIARLSKLTQVRNQTAHRSFLLTYEEQKDLEFLDKEREKLEKLETETKACVYDLLAEIEKLGELDKKGKANGVRSK
jgi:hypothetical protein